ncbi:MAG: hypothetical protein HQK54_02595 [Oligoflexales bacterium]|nr:hypothetical protein [Oligoflexales bacterium]
MAASRQKSKKLIPAANKKKRLTNDEISLLETFCNDVIYQEISYGDWLNYHETLDLTVKLALTKDEAERGCKKEIFWTRTIYSEKTGVQVLEKREKVSRIIEIPPGVKNGGKIVFSKLGDQKKNAVGDLKIIISIIS